jgi:hypothetical protein
MIGSSAALNVQPGSGVPPSCGKRWVAVRAEWTQDRRMNAVPYDPVMVFLISLAAIPAISFVMLRAVRDIGSVRLPRRRPRRASARNSVRRRP